MTRSIVVGIPGAWASREQFVVDIANKSGGFLFAGMIMMDVASSEGCEVQIYQHDPAMRRSFQIAGQGRLSESLLDEIDRHSQTAYLIGYDLSREGVERLRRFVAGVLRAGGLAVKVETAGVAWSPAEWNAAPTPAAITDLYTYFTTYVAGKTIFYSCGMKHFGLPDASTSAALTSHDALQLMHAFNLYQLAEQAVLKPGQTFAETAESQRFVLTHEPYPATYEEDDPLHNPFGRWHLEPLAG